MSMRRLFAGDCFEPLVCDSRVWSRGLRIDITVPW